MFWCGNPKLKTCSADEGKLFKVSPGVAVKIIPRSSTTVESSAQTSSPTSSDIVARAADSVASSDTTTCSGATEAEKLKFANAVTAVGAGVGVPFGVLALAFLGLFLNERRLRKKLTKPSDMSDAGVAYGPVNNTYQGQDYGQGQVQGQGQAQGQEQVQYVYKAENEMPANRDPAHELTGGHHRPVHELGGPNYPN